MFCELHIKLIFYESPISYDYESHPLDDHQALGWLDNTDVLPPFLHTGILISADNIFRSELHTGRYAQLRMNKRVVNGV